MRTRPSFAEVLEEALDAAQDDTPRAAERFVYLPASAAPFVYVYSRPSGAATSLGAPAAAAPAARARRAYERPASATPSRTPSSAPTGLVRALTPRQQRAFEAMVALGAGLRGDFEAADLRRAFRQLAHAYHPDRHPTSSPAELELLSKTFADLANHYRCLLALFDRKR